MKEMGIYRWRNIINNNCYVGSSVNLKRRERGHRYCLDRGIHHSKYLQRGWVKHGADVLVFEVIESITDRELLKAREQYYLDTLKPCYNMNPVADRPPLNPDRSYVNTPEYRAKLGAWSRGPEYRQKMSEALKGRKISKRHRNSLSKALKGKKKSIEHCESLSKALKGKKIGFAVVSLQERRRGTTP